MNSADAGPTGDRFGIFANNRGDRVLRRDAKVRLLAFSLGRAEVEGLSLGGRRVRRWVPLKHLCCFRAAWLFTHSGLSYESREDAQRVATNLEIGA